MLNGMVQFVDMEVQSTYQLMLRVIGFATGFLHKGACFIRLQNNEIKKNNGDKTDVYQMSSSPTPMSMTKRLNQAFEKNIYR